MRAPSAARIRPHDGIAAEDPRLHQAAARDGAGQIARHLALRHAGDVDDEQLGGALPVGGDRAGQIGAAGW